MVKNWVILLCNNFPKLTKIKNIGLTGLSRFMTIFGQDHFNLTEIPLNHT